ncbi:hypothetical protein BGZ68_000963 [Mortierella alpina]|nr:hypothetical protein BGZ68_000963 [Mortierella alpina]
MASARVMEEAIGKTQLPPSLQGEFVIQTLNNNHTSASTVSAPSQSPPVDLASPYRSLELTSLEHKFTEFLNLSSSLAKDKTDTQDKLKTDIKVEGNGDRLVNGSPLHDSVGLIDTANRQDLPTPSLSPSPGPVPIKTPIYYSYFYGSECDSSQEYEGTEYDWGDEMVVFEQYDRYGDAFFSSSPPYIPFDYNTLNPDLDPDDSNYYVHVPEYEYVTLTDDDEAMSEVDYGHEENDMFEFESDRRTEESSMLC